MLPFAEAQRIVLDNTPVVGREKVPLRQALGRVLAEEIVSGVDVPPWDNSAVDGFAVRVKDLKGASRQNPIVLRVVEEVPAGRVSLRPLGEGEAIRIMTGAAIPAGTEAVVMVEDTEAMEEDKVGILREVGVGANIRRRGEDLQAGSKVLAPGTVLGAAEIGVLASLNRGYVFVHRRPRVGILATGDELVEVGEARAPGQIVSSNTYTLTCQVEQCGGIPFDLGIAADRVDHLRERLREGLDCDLLITSGGVSMGEYDLVREALQGMPGEMKFWRVAMRPGMPTAFGLLDGKPFLGLPGNPVSSMVCFELFARPALLKMGGHTCLFRPSLLAVAQEEIRIKSGRRHFLRVRLERVGEEIRISLTGDQGSGILTSLVQAHGLAEIPEDTPLIRPGERVKVLLLDRGLTFLGREDRL